MENSEIKEVLILTLDTFINTNPDELTGICRTIGQILLNRQLTPKQREYYRANRGFKDITDEFQPQITKMKSQFYHVENFLQQHKPSFNPDYKEFIQANWMDAGFWWDRVCDNHNTKEIRINFLIKVINNIK